MCTIPLSSLQHYIFCPRQCALIHNESDWEENLFTALGKVLHERVDSAGPETRHGVRIERSVHVSSERFGLSGVVDMVERDIQTGTLKPVEYKRGKPKPDLSDEVQLCAQGFCLEEMTGRRVVEGALWYGEIRHRVAVTFSESLRSATVETIENVRRLLRSCSTPPPKYTKRCKACSLIEHCKPELIEKDRSKLYVAMLYTEEEDA